MGWYRVIKAIKGHRYVYLQRTWREGKHVRTESRYIGPADGGGGRAPEREDRADSDAKASGTTGRTLYHGSRETGAQRLLISNPFAKAWIGRYRRLNEGYSRTWGMRQEAAYPR